MPDIHSHIACVETSIRGGNGMFYDTRMNGLLNNGQIGTNPFPETYTVSNSTARDSTAAFSNPYGKATNPATAPFPLSLR